MENTKELLLKLTSIECMMLACMFHGEILGHECPEEEKTRIEANIELLLNKMDIVEFRQYFMTITQFDDRNIDQVHELMEKMNEIVIDPTQEDRAKFIADLMVITRNKQ